MVTWTVWSPPPALAPPPVARPPMGWSNEPFSFPALAVPEEADCARAVALSAASARKERAICWTRLGFMGRLLHNTLDRARVHPRTLVRGRAVQYVRPGRAKFTRLPRVVMPPA